MGRQVVPSTGTSKRRHVARPAVWIAPALSLVIVVGAAPSGGPTSAAPSSALNVLSGIPVRKERPAGYSRELFRHWIDADGDQCNTREEVLIAESAGRPQVDPFGCKVIAGDWYSPYDGVAHEDPTEMDIDHVVALKEAWDSGAWAWSDSRRRAYANDLSDPRPLIAVSAGVNRSKGDKDPSNWLPPNRTYLCTYLSDWVAVKARWGLSMDQSEHGRIRKLLSGACAGTSLAAWGTARAPGGDQDGGTDAGAGGSAGSGDQTSGSQTTVVKGISGFKPGQFCAPLGATGSYNGLGYLCSKSNAQGVPYKDSRARWRRG